eukprot:10494785-Lingulodinium_polyedra.AAC.1
MLRPRPSTQQRLGAATCRPQHCQPSSLTPRTPSSWPPTLDLALRLFRKHGHAMISQGAAER